MKKSLLLLAISLLFFISNVLAQNSIPIIINELSQGSGGSPSTDEWIELLVTADGVDIQGVYLDVDNRVGDLGSNISVQLSTTYGGFLNVSKGSIIVIYNSANKDPNLPSIDTDFSDGTLLIPSNNTTFLSTTGWKTSKASGGGDAIGLFNPKTNGGSTINGIMAIAWQNYTGFPDNFTNGWGYAVVTPPLTTSSGLKYTGGTTAGVATAGNWSVENDVDSSPGTTNGGSNDALPVELTSFSASVVNGSTVNLIWKTATEVNNYGFDVERFSGNTGWQNIGFVAGAGNSNSPRNYSFNDNPSGGTSFSYRLKQVDIDGNFEYFDAITVNLIASSKPKLLQNNPNPFNPSTTIKFFVPNPSDVTIKIYDLLGREVTTLFNKQATAGYHNVYWNGKDSRGENVSSGVYLYRLTAGNFSETKKMNLLK
ncbi:MAG TPA: T9SS type A sorting domain-containing protein [Ignavibacteriaceae bacterium]|nr:T9SS type A sorting domain-containing protein [Ignavibacteriaceae bacterium]